jgi:hypothetical protein
VFIFSLDTVAIGLIENFLKTICPAFATTCQDAYKDQEPGAD